MKRVAVVTGANKGIGLAIVKGLVKVFSGDVILTARNSELGVKAATDVLQETGKPVQFHKLDLNDEASVKDLATFLKSEYGGLDVLVNNAAIAFSNDAPEPFGVQAEVTLATNYWATKRACEVLFPLLRPGARVVNLSSSLGHLGGRQGGQEPEWSKIKAKLGDPNLTVETLDSLVLEFEVAAKAGDHFEKGFPNSAYGMSKVFISALSRIQQRAFDADPDSDEIVNHVHPGFVDTDMTRHKGILTTEQGAKSSIFAATLPPHSDIRGKFIWSDCRIIDWLKKDQ